MVPLFFFDGAIVIVGDIFQKWSLLKLLGLGSDLGSGLGSDLGSDVGSGS